MTTKFRIDAINLQTTEGMVRYTFPSELTVLAGRTGVGKTTLLELIKFGLGGKAVLADVALNHVETVTVDTSVGASRLQLSRSLDAAKQDIVRVTDLISQERMPDHRVSERAAIKQYPSLNSLLMTALGLPDGMRAASSTKGSSQLGNRITFADVFAFLYIPQSAINQQIAHSEESYREPKRKAVFELLFGLTDTTILALQSQVNELNGKINSAVAEHEVVLAFLHDSDTTRRLEAERAFADALGEEETALAEQASLREGLAPSTDRETLVLRDLLNAAEISLAEARNVITDLSRQQGEYTAERRRVQTDINRLQRMHDAGERLAPIEFTACPRCMQSLTGRSVPPGSCRVCLLPDPISVIERPVTDQYESMQLTEQLIEMDDQLSVIAQQLVEVRQIIADREQLVRELTEKIDARTAERITPRLQAFSDAAARLTAARTRQQYLEQVLRQWDRVDDLDRVVQQLNQQRDGKFAEIDRARKALKSRREEILDALNEEFQETVAALGIPSVKTAGIDRTNYLPILNGRRYSKFSGPGGGIITATQVAYWLSLLTVALRDRLTLYPAFLMIDSPRLALHSAETVAAAVYDRLVRQADASRERAFMQDPVQLIIADNELADTYRSAYPEINFSYDHPTISTIEHPGLDAVQLLAGGVSVEST